jgi:hypothetical protein
VSERADVYRYTSMTAKVLREAGNILVSASREMDTEAESDEMIALGFRLIAEANALETHAPLADLPPA